MKQYKVVLAAHEAVLLNINEKFRCHLEGGSVSHSALTAEQKGKLIFTYLRRQTRSMNKIGF